MCCSVRERSPDRDVLDYSLASEYLCVVRADHRVACRNIDGSTTKPSLAPELDFVDVETTGVNHTCGVTQRGELWCWGHGLAACGLLHSAPEEGPGRVTNAPASLVPNTRLGGGDGSVDDAKDGGVVFAGLCRGSV